MFLHKLTFLEVRKCDVLFAVTFYGLSQDQCWPLRFDNMKLNSKKMTTPRSNHFLTEKSNQLKSHSQLYIHCFSNGKLCQPVLLCESIISSHPVPGAKCSWRMAVPLGLGIQMAFPRKSTKSPSLTSIGPTIWMTLPQTICHTPRSWRFVHTRWHSTATYHYQPSPTCCEICIQILDQTAISTDSYHPGSIKAQERLRRSSPESILAGSAVRKPYYSKSFLANDDTKEQLCQVCCMEW